jgi:hypothetical protein
MSKVKIQGHASGTGVLTVTAPNTSTDRTITLPDSTGTLATTADIPAGISSSADGTAITIDSNEIVTMPSHPAFIANSTVSQAISNATSTTINFTTEIADRNSDYDGTNTFTAPVTGLYSFSAQVIVDAGTTPDTRFSEAYLYILTSNREATFYWGDLESNADDQLAMQGTALMDMDAGDTAIVRVFYSRHGASGGTNTVGHSTHLRTFFTGHLVC